MKKAIFVSAALAVGLAAGAAVAADIPRGPIYRGSVMAPTVYNWAGAYAGLNVGYQWGSTTNNPTSPSGIAGGGQIGYNWQNGQWVFGVETDAQLSGASDTFAPWKFSNPWFGTLRARGGWAINNVLLYGTFGLAYGNLHGEIPGLDETRTLVGWAGGIGGEYGFAPNWSAKIEYLYMDLGSRAFTVTGVNNGLHSNLVRFGFNYHF